jgi:hypothetical protein
MLSRLLNLNNSTLFGYEVPQGITEGNEEVGERAQDYWPPAEESNSESPK